MLASLFLFFTPSICMMETYFWQRAPDTQLLPCRYPAASVTPRSICLSPSPHLSPCLHLLPISPCSHSSLVQHRSFWLTDLWPGLPALCRVQPPHPFPLLPPSPPYLPSIPPTGPSSFWAISFALCGEGLANAVCSVNHSHLAPLPPPPLYPCHCTAAHPFLMRCSLFFTHLILSCLQISSKDVVFIRC